MALSESLTVTRKRTFRGINAKVEDVLTKLHEDHFTGKLVVNMTQGGVSSVTAEDSQDVRVQDGALVPY